LPLGVFFVCTYFGFWLHAWNMSEELLQHTMPRRKCSYAVRKTSIKRRDHEQLLCNTEGINTTEVRGKSGPNSLDDEEVRESGPKVGNQNRRIRIRECEQFVHQYTRGHNPGKRCLTSKVKR